VTIKEIILPDLGSTTDVTVVEIAIQAGSIVKKEDTLLTLEGEKASMEVPSPYSGTIKEIKIKVGDKVNIGHLIASIDETEETQENLEKTFPKSTPPAKPAQTPTPTTSFSTGNIHAGPAVRMLARELEIDLSKLKGTGHKNRITKEDLITFIKQKMSQGSGLPTPPQIDFAHYGVIETRPLSRIKKISATNLHRNWLLIPHVTQFDEADITDLEIHRKSKAIEAEKQGFKLTLLAFIMKACVAILQKFPQFNASLDIKMENLILKKYFHFGIAVDTADGLVVPVVRDVDQKTVFQLAKELGEISQKARTKELKPKDMQGNSFTISSLGGIGGTAFTPIINMPDVAILGISRSYQKPIYQNQQFIPRLVLPLSLSYDHRVIDGAEGARFITTLSSELNTVR